MSESLRDAAKVVESVQKFWGVIPYDSYHILNLITDTRGGLEHLDSTVLMTSRFATLDRDKYVEWLALVCHEVFHAWNVKRLRPAALGPFDYEKEVFTSSLWVSEGITSYYDDLLVRRAGLSTRAEYLKALSGQLNTLMGTPGRKSLPLTEASLDAWIRLYQPTSNSVNDDVSYYNKGAVVAWLLDTEIRKATNGARTLDDVMRRAFVQFAERGFQEQEFRDLAAEVSGVDLQAFFVKALDTTEELPIADALEYWGLEWEPEDAKVAAEPYLGIHTTTGDSRSVESVLAGSPAALAGVSPGDELLAIDGVRVPAAGPGAISKFLKVGSPYPLLLSRLGRVREVTIVGTAQPAPKRGLKVRSGKGARMARIEAWLGPDSKVPESGETAR
jgi:predicted metalloprotease with PDZ domain